jgi:hypothetical protein
MYCMTPSDANTCILSGNTSTMHQTQDQCIADGKAYAEKLLSDGIYARYACFQLGTSV